MDSNDVLFSEYYAAAQSLKNVWTRLASTYGCMMIVLSGKRLMIKPHWFAKWLISLLQLDLCHEIPLTRIRGVKETGRWLNYGKVELLFQTVEGKDQKILLYMKKSREFVEKVSIGNLDHKSQRRRRVAHTAWAAIAIIVSFFMIFTKQRGDPPMIVFVPLVLIIWVVGHLVIWAVKWLAARGRRIVSESGGEPKPWPIGLRLALIGTGIPTLILIFQVLMTGLHRKWYQYPDACLWGVMLAIWLVHGVCFVGLLLHQQWSPLVSAMLLASGPSCPRFAAKTGGTLVLGNNNEEDE
jgi:hypothetical protein